MGRETALAFFEKIQQDPALRRKLSSMTRRDVPALLRLAADYGYFFNARDYQAALEYNGELSDEVHRKIAQGHYVIPGVNAPE
jgi:predicted ribosomally synthesized peptide with nif11-like leader